MGDSKSPMYFIAVACAANIVLDYLLFEVLNTIRYLRALDMPLTEIEDFLKNRDISKIEEKLVQQKKIVLEKQ